jgi:hypothetical protein
MRIYLKRLGRSVQSMGTSISDSLIVVTNVEC